MSPQNELETADNQILSSLIFEDDDQQALTRGQAIGVDAQFDRYMKRVKKTSLLSSNELVRISRRVYGHHYQAIIVLSQFPPCVGQLVAQYQHHRENKFKYSNFLTGIGDQSPDTRESQHRFNQEHGPDSAPESIDDPETIESTLADLAATYERFRAAEDASAAAEPRKALAQKYRMVILRHPELDEHRSTFVDFTDLVREFNDLLDRNVASDVRDFLINNFCLDSIEAIAPLLEESDRYAWHSLALRVMKICRDTHLTVDQILSLRVEYDQYRQAFRRSVNQIVEANLLLAARSALRNNPNHERLFDTCQEANEGLITAAERFSYWRGYSFSTYAATWIKYRVMRYLDHNSNAWGIPFSISLRAHKVRATRDQIANSDGYGLNPVPPRLIAQSLGMEVSVVDETLQAYKSPVNEDIVLDGQSTGLDDCTDLANESELKRIIRAAIDTLPEERREICKMRMGIDMPRVMMLKEVAEKLNTTSEVVRKKEKDCLRLLRNGRFGRHLHELFAHA